MNRAFKDAPIKRYHYDSHDQRRAHLADVPGAYNYARYLKMPTGPTTYEDICKIWTFEPERFILYQMPRLNR